jgi:hypothetical protein
VKLPKTLEATVKKLAKAMQAKAEYDSLRAHFHELVDVEVAKEPLPEEVFELEAGLSEEDIEEIVGQDYPDYELVEASEVDEGDDFYISVRIRKKPEYMPFSFVDPTTKKVVGRTVRKGRDYLDLSLFREHFPEYERAIAQTYQVDGELVKEILAEVPELADRFKLISETIDNDIKNEIAEEDPEIVNALEDCTFPGKPSVALTPLRDATDEDL